MKETADELRERLAQVDNPAKLLEGILIYAPVGLQIYAADGRCLLVTPAFRELLGAAPAAGFNVREGGAPGEPGLRQWIRRSFAGETVVIPPTWYEPRDLRQIGIVEPAKAKRVALGCTAFPLLDGSGAVAYVVVTFKDVTAEMLARERAEDAARKAEESLALLDTLMRTAPVGLCLLDRDLRYVRINDALAEINGIPPEQHIGRTLREMVPKMAPVIEPYHHEVLATGKPIVDLEVSGETDAAPGVQRTWSVAYYPVRSASGDILGIGNAVMEITGRKRMERELGERVRELADADRRKDEFLAILSHELRNPLSPIVTALEMIRSGRLDSRRRERAHAIIERQVGQLTRLVDDLLDMARISRGSIELRHEIVSVQEVITGTAEAVRARIESRRHDLELALPEAPLLVRGDPVRLEQALANLMDNAARYTEPGGRITVRAKRRAGEISVSVEDTGAGLTREALQTVFEPFQRRAGYKAREGLGIGLTITRRLVELHQGRVEAQSEGPGRGATFTVYLPAAEEVGDAAGAPTQAVLAGSALQRRVLVVDDNVDAAVLTGDLLVQQGYDVRVVHDGASTLDEFARYDPDVVLLDIGLPDMDGFEVARRLRQSGGPKKLVLIATTGYGQPADRRRSREAGFDHHLVKPIDVARVLELLREA